MELLLELSEQWKMSQRDNETAGNMSVKSNDTGEGRAHNSIVGRHKTKCINSMEYRRT